MGVFNSPSFPSSPPSSVDPLALNYLTFGFFPLVNNLWTWIALITAAVSFWRIKTASSSSSCTKVHPHHDQNMSSNSNNGPAEPEQEPEESSSQSFTASAPPTPAISLDGVAKTKFTSVYYKDKEEEEENFHQHKDDLHHVWEEMDIKNLSTLVEQDSTTIVTMRRTKCLNYELEWWDGLLRLRMGEQTSHFHLHLHQYQFNKKGNSGWYSPRFQDLADLNGNVVRFWD